MAAVRKIVSGGQTGADRAALDFARRNGVPHGGWCPRGRKSESGVIPPRYQLLETKSRGYLQRTSRNVRDSDGTVIFSLTPRLKGGSRATARFARKARKPLLHLAATETTAEAAAQLQSFVRKHRIRILNVAGPRKSEAPSVGRFVQRVLRAGLVKRDVTR